MRLSQHLTLPLLTCALLACFLPTSQAQNELRDDIHAYTLKNGLRVIMVVRDFAPVIDFNFTFGVGGVDEPEGLGGIAHMVEHMAFKGTRSIGSLDIDAEEQALETLEIAASALDIARRAGLTGDALAAFETDLSDAQAAAQALAIPNALDALFTDNGGQGLNASTAYDRTAYTVSLPANRLELYARVYADVLTNAFFRSFYEERDVVREERRQRSEDQPDGVLSEAFFRTAFKKSPYGRPLIGSAQEIEGYTATEAEGIYKVFYHPNNAVLVMVGDLKPERDMAIIRKYFDFVPRGPVSNAKLPSEPKQTAERRVEVPFAAEPSLLVGYHKPTLPNRDAYTLDVLDYILGQGRSSRLYRSLVTEQQLALDVSTSSGAPGIRLPNLFVIQATPRAPNTTQDLETAIYAQLTDVAENGVTEAELKRARTLLRADVLRGLASGSGLAASLAFNELFAGGWEKLFDDLDTYDTVTAAEIQDAAARTFLKTNRTVATLVTKAPTQEAQ